MKNYRIVPFDELNALLEQPFNDPAADPNFDEERFCQENSDMHQSLQQKLETMGRFDEDETDDDDADFWMQESDDVTRCISVTLTSRKMWNESLISLIQSFLQTLPEDYLVYVDSSLDLEEPIYIIVTKNEVLGSADQKQSLVSFGFSA